MITSCRILIEDCVVANVQLKMSDEGSQYLPTVWQLIVIAMLLLLGGVFSGLSLGTLNLKDYLLNLYLHLLVHRKKIPVMHSDDGVCTGLMQMDPNRLKIVAKSGTPQMKKFAKIIYPIRRNGNYLLCMFSFNFAELPVTICTRS